MELLNESDKSKLWSLFQNLKENKAVDANTLRNSVLVIDGL